MRSAFMRGVAVAISVFVATAAAWAGVQGPAGHVGSVKADGRARLQEVTVERMQTMIRRHLENHRNTKVTEIQVTILDPTESVMIPSGSLEGRIISNSLDAGYGRRGFDLALFVKGKQAETVRVFADVAAIGEVVTATRMIRPDETIAAEDVTMTRVKFSGAPQDVVANPDEAIGKRAVKPIRPEAPILFSMLAQPYAVRRGDRVTIEARRGGLLIQASGVTKAAGFAGQTLTVTNQDSGKDISAKVVGPGVVQVDF